MTTQRPDDAANTDGPMLNSWLLETIPFCMDVVDADGRILYLNAAMARAAGPIAVGHKCWEVYRDDGRQCPACPLQQPIEIGVTRTCDSSDVLGGKTFEIHHTGIEFRGQPALLEVFVDISHRRQAAQTLARSEQLLQDVADGMPALVYALDVEGHFTLVNRQFEREFDLPRESILGRTRQGMMPERLAAERRANDLTVMRERRPVVTEEAHDHADGRHFYLSVRYPLFDAEGACTGVAAVSTDITERKAQEQAVLESEARFRAVFDHSLDAMSVTRDGAYVFGNMAFLRLFGYEGNDEVVGKNAGSVVAPEQRDFVADLVRRRRFGNAPARYETRGVRKDGSQFDMAVSVAQYEDKDGQYNVVMLRDITEERRNTEALRASTERFEMMSRATTDALWDWDIATERVWWSVGLSTGFGYEIDRENLSDGWWHARIHPDDRARVDLRFLNAVDGTDTFWSDDYRFCRADGTYAKVYDRGLITRDGNGRATRMLGAMLDISELARAEDNVRRQAALLDLANDAISVRDIDGRVRYWNKAAERFTGWTASEMVGKRNFGLIYQDRAALQTAMDNAVSAGSWTGELLQVARDGRSLVVSSSWTLVRDAHGNPDSVLIINTDVTEHKKLEAQFLRAQRLESVGRLTGGIAHDLNNILSPILMAANLMEEDSTLAKDAHDLVATVEAGAQRGADLVKQLLLFARGTEGTRVAVPPRRLLKDMVKMARATFPKSVSMEFDAPDGLWSIEGDPTQLHQVLMNLCVNASDAMPDGGHIRLSAENVTLDADAVRTRPEAEEGQFVVLQVADNGFGIPREFLNQIFDPFFTTKTEGKGTGLGLATVAGIVKNHGGFVEVESTVGNGTQFSIYLPAVPPAVAVPEPAREGRMPQGDGALVLVIDDEAPLLDLTRMMLEINGYRVLTATGGAEALRLFVEHQNDVALVVTDMAMPQLDGAATIDALRRIRSDVKVVIISGTWAPVGELPDGATASEFVAKPFTMDTLLRAVHRSITGAH